MARVQNIPWAPYYQWAGLLHLKSQYACAPWKPVYFRVEQAGPIEFFFPASSLSAAEGVNRARGRSRPHLYLQPDFKCFKAAFSFAPLLTKWHFCFSFIWWCASRHLPTNFLQAWRWAGPNGICTFANFHGVNTLTMANIKYQRDILRK